jgi:hypothetical protein
MMTVNEHLKYLRDLRAEQLLWRPLWKDITDYALPRRSFWDIDITQGAKPVVKIYDGTAIADLQLLVDGIQGNLMSPAFPWIGLEMESPQMNRLEGVGAYLEDLQTIFLAEYARTNFYEAINELLMDLAGLGTGVLYVDDDVEHRRINFSARHLKECFIAENAQGRVDVLYRDYVLNNKQAFQIWGTKLTKQRQERARDNPFGKGHYVHAVYPALDRSGNAKMYTSVYIDRDMPEFIDVGGYDQFPYLVPRWRKNTDESYGRSPAADAIWDILRVNQMAKTLLQAAQFATEPPLNVPAAMKGLERIVPRGFNYFTNPGEVITPINLAQNYPIGQDTEVQVRQQIHDIFRTKVFLLIEQLEKGPYTATEIRERVAEKAAVMGPVISRLNDELLIPLVDRTYLICQKNGILPQPPPTLTQTARVRIRFRGPLAQAQEKYHQSQGITAAMQFLQVSLPMNQAVGDNVEWDEYTRIGMDSMGAPQRTIRSKEQVDKMRAIQAKAQQDQVDAQKEADQQKLIAQNADKLNQTPNPNSMLVNATKAELQKQAAKQGGGQ